MHFFHDDGSTLFFASRKETLHGFEGRNAVDVMVFPMYLIFKTTFWGQHDLTQCLDVDWKHGLLLTGSFDPWWIQYADPPGGWTKTFWPSFFFWNFARYLEDMCFNQAIGIINSDNFNHTFVSCETRTVVPWSHQKKPQVQLEKMFVTSKHQNLWNTWKYEECTSKYTMVLWTCMSESTNGVPEIQDVLV